MRNAIVDQILMERMNRRGGYDGRDYARGDYGRGGYDGRRGRDYGRDYARGGRDGRDGNYDEERFEDEDEKYLMEIQDGRRGVKGTGRGRRRGPHFNMEQVMEAAKAVGIRFEDFDERELCMTVNMLYSDYCEVNKPYVSPERECHYYVELAKAFLEDDDGPEPSEKLALYYYCIAENE